MVPCLDLVFLPACIKAALGVARLALALALPAVCGYDALKLSSVLASPLTRFARGRMEPGATCKLSNDTFLDAALSYVLEELQNSKCFRLLPTKKLTLRDNQGKKIPASSLRVGNKDAHFALFDTELAEKQWVIEYIEDLFQRTKRTLKRPLFPSIGQCMGNILKKVSLLRGGTKPCTVHSEADLRFAITDPIMEMISDC